MRKTQEEQTWDSLNKEYCHFKQLATRENIPSVEQKYYNSITNHIQAQRDSIRIPKKREDRKIERY
jgi:hypothetical protein